MPRSKFNKCTRLINKYRFRRTRPKEWPRNTPAPKNWHIRPPNGASHNASPISKWRDSRARNCLKIRASTTPMRPNLVWSQAISMSVASRWTWEAPRESMRAARRFKRKKTLRSLRKHLKRAQMGRILTKARVSTAWAKAKSLCHSHCRKKILSSRR